MRLAFALLALLLLATPACDSDGGGGGPVSGSVTLGKDDGVDFHSGALLDPGNFKNSDIYTASNGNALGLLTGGTSPTVNRPANWFLGAGGVHRTFSSLAEVPDEPPSDDMTASLIKAKTGNGFIVMTHKGALVRGWVSFADADTVTIEFEPYVAPTE